MKSPTFKPGQLVVYLDRMSSGNQNIVIGLSIDTVRRVYTRSDGTYSYELDSKLTVSESDMYDAGELVARIGSAFQNRSLLTVHLATQWSEKA